MRRHAPFEPIYPNIWMWGGVYDVINCANFFENRPKGFGASRPQILAFPIDFAGRPYNTLSDTSDIIFRKNSFSGKVNNVLCYFATCTRDIKFRLMRQYCFDFYGSVLWDLSHPSVDDICAAWRKAARRVWGLPYRTHSISALKCCVYCSFLLYLSF